jgi:AcrR family transcriptional regulator
MSTASPRRLTRKGQQSRQRIVSAAADLIFDQGVAHTTIEDVRAAADVSSSQLYHYFDDKPALVRAVIEQQADTIVAGRRRSTSAAWMACAPGVTG